MTKETTPTTIIDKTFDPAEIEARWYAHWESTGAFRPARPDAAPFTIVIPPPNVTGSLHIGHALDNTLQDVLIRYHRLKGDDALWVVGTDHAGIATQMVVERQLESSSQGIKRADLGREKFLDHVWDWKRESGGTITRQLRRLGASCDWANERFTMDPGFNKAVIKVFVQLYNEGLLYRDKRLVNWDPHFKTAISDLEVETREVQGHFWHFRYPLADGVKLADGRDHIVVATTRPETMLGDMAVAVNAADPRYQSVIGKFVELPITGRRIPIIADDHADPELGSGAVKITPGHDFNDFEVGRRAGIAASAMLNIFDAQAHIAAADGVPAHYVGMERFAARESVVAEFEALGLLEAVEDKTVGLPFGDRSGVVIEPWLTDQWYVDAATLAKPAIEAVRSGATKFVPQTWEKTYFNWMENIQPWCASRQLWWGHRIPAWYGPPLIDGMPTYDLSRGKSEFHAFVCETEDDALEQAQKYYSKSGRVVRLFETLDGFIKWALSDERDVNILGIWRDEDVLDTWFSSALWPFGTLGWPDSPSSSNDVIPAKAGTHHPTAEEMGPRFRGDDAGGGANDAARAAPQDLLARHYPTSVLVTGFDIIFFWVARMMMQGIHFMHEPPFATVYCHGLVRDAKGQKMSKSKGNVVDPLILIDKYGADALRFTLTAMESQGRDIKLSEPRIEGYRNFATKLWNAARFCQSNGIAGSTSAAAPAATQPVNQWIIGEVIATAQALDAAMTAFRFDDYASTIYQFAWSRFCDWYLELTKPLLAEGADAAVAAETRAVAGWALDQILVMLHPVMPFITEELWHKLGARESDLILAAWPVLDNTLIDAAASDDVERLIETISSIRSQRIDVGISPSPILPIAVLNPVESDLAFLNRHRTLLGRLARIRPAGIEMRSEAGFVFRLETAQDTYTGATRFDTTSFTALQFPIGGMTLVAIVDGFVDLAAERTRLEKAALSAEKEAAALTGRLGSPGFVEKAKPEAVEKARDDLAARSAEAERLRAALARLG